MAGLYVHVPFCRAKCHYCDFASTADLSVMDTYLEALAVEASFHEGAEPLGTLYIGGGTPSVLGAERFARLMALLAERFDLSRCCEKTVEVNPESATEDFFAAMTAAGINRLSMGAQTLDDGLLETLGRKHDRALFEAAFDRARRWGMTNVSVDLMIGLPGQGPAHVRHTLDRLLEKRPEHLSVYSLKVEEGTAFHQRGIEEDEEMDRLLDHQVERRLVGAGYERYELSNYALPGYASAHNRGYWTLVPYIGLGPSAHGDDGCFRYANDPSLAGYMNRLLEIGERPLVVKERMDEDERLFETMVLGLRLLEGVDLFAVRERFGKDPLAGREKQVQTCIEDGLLVQKDGHLILTPLGRDLSNRVMMLFA